MTETPSPQPAHGDDIAVDEFAAAMKAKLADARAKGRHGWQTCSQADLTDMLHEHVAKGDPRDVANFCMFLWKLGHGIKPVSGYSYTESMAYAEGFQRGYAQPPAVPHGEKERSPLSVAEIRGLRAQMNTRCAMVGHETLSKIVRLVERAHSIGVIDVPVQGSQP